MSPVEQLRRWQGKTTQLSRAAPIGGSFQLWYRGAAEAKAWFDSLSEKKNETQVKGQTEKANASVCWESCSLWSETSTCLLHVLLWGSWLWRWRTHQLCLWNSGPGREKSRSKTKQLYLCWIHFLIYSKFYSDRRINNLVCEHLDIY